MLREAWGFARYVGRSSSSDGDFRRGIPESYRSLPLRGFELSTAVRRKEFLPSRSCNYFSGASAPPSMRVGRHVVDYAVRDRLLPNSSIMLQGASARKREGG